MSTTDFKGPKSCISGGEPGSHTRGDLFQRGVCRNLPGISALHLRLMLMTDTWPNPHTVLWKMPLPLFLLTLLAATMQMTQERAGIEGPLPGLREQGSVDSLLHRCLLSGGERGVRWITQEKGSHLNGFTFVKMSAGHKWLQRKETCQPSGHQPHYFIPLFPFVFCFHTLFGLASQFLLHRNPVYPSRSMPRTILPPQLTYRNTQFIPARPALLCWIEIPKHKMCRRGYLLCECSVLLDITEISPLRCCPMYRLTIVYETAHGPRVQPKGIIILIWLGVRRT